MRLRGRNNYETINDKNINVYCYSNNSSNVWMWVNKLLMWVNELFMWANELFSQTQAFQATSFVCLTLSDPFLCVF